MAGNDNDSRCLLALSLAWSYSATGGVATLQEARVTAEASHGPLSRKPFVVTDNGCSFIARHFARYVQYDYAHVRLSTRSGPNSDCWSAHNRPSRPRDGTRGCLRAYRMRGRAPPSSGPAPAMCDRTGHSVPEEGGDPPVSREVYVEGQAEQLHCWRPWARDVRRRLDEPLILAAG